MEEEGVAQLFPDGDIGQCLNSESCSLRFAHLFSFSRSTDLPETLKNLNKSFVFNYLELLDILSHDPGPQSNPQWISKVQHLHTILKNCHYLVNLYRPHQARATLQQMLEAQIAERREAAALLKKARADVEAELTKLVGNLRPWIEKQKTLEPGPKPIKAELSQAVDDDMDTEENENKGVL